MEQSIRRNNKKQEACPIYCIKVPEGQDRKELRKYSGAFLPSYVAIDPNSTSKYESRGIRKFIIPGYIFSIHKEGKAVTVPEKKWKIIEALSDSHPSFINEEGKIIFGPLACLNDLIKSAEDNRIQIQASLLGEERIYWIQVRNAGEEKESPPESKQPDTKAEIKEAAKMEYTQEQIRQILIDAEINGIHAAARSAGVPWQTVLRWARERNLNIPSRKHISARKRAEKANPETNEKSATANADLSQAKAENVALKNRVKQLEEEIRKLQKAITELI